MTLQRKLLLGFSLMVLPTLFVGVEAIRTNALERGTLETLRQRLAQSRTYADVEDAMFNQTQVVWRYLSGDPAAKREFPLTEQVVDYWLDRWAAGLAPEDVKLADGVRKIEGEIRAVAGRVFQLYDAGHHEAASLTARRELVERLQPALAGVNREIYRQAREFSVQRAVVQVQAIVEKVDRLDLRIAHLLQFSRPAPFHPLRESVRSLVDGALSGFSELLRQRQVELALHAPATLPDIQVDPMRLEQVLIELVSNALDAMPEGGRLEITTRVEVGEGAAGGVVVEITDSGRGIAPEILPNLCEPFFTTRPEGTGLGLAIAKRYVEEAGGRLDISSALGRGTTVRLWLPVASGDVAPEPARSIA